MVDINKQLTAPENCPSFDKCSFNDCPLEKQPNKLKVMPEDRLAFDFKKCRAGKKVRMQIATAFGIKNKGLTLRELDSMRKSIRMKKEMISTQTNELKKPYNHTLEIQKEVEQKCLNLNNFGLNQRWENDN